MRAIIIIIIITICIINHSNSNSNNHNANNNNNATTTTTTTTTTTNDNNNNNNNNLVGLGEAGRLNFQQLPSRNMPIPTTHSLRSRYLGNTTTFANSCVYITCGNTAAEKVFSISE